MALFNTAAMSYDEMRRDIELEGHGFVKVILMLITLGSNWLI